VLYPKFVAILMCYCRLMKNGFIQ